MSTYVIGHKNPDTDSICSAIAYSDFLQHSAKMVATAARCGEIGARTAFILQKAKIDQPHLVMDVRPHAGQICRREITLSYLDETFMDSFDRMRGSKHRSMPVLDRKEKLVGMLSLSKMMDQLVPSRGKLDHAREIRTSLKRIQQTLGGSFQNEVDIEREDHLHMLVAAFSANLFNKRLQEFDPQKSIIIMGNRPSVQLPAIEYGVRAIIITGNNPISSTIMERAKEKGVTVLLSPMDTATTTLLMRCAQPISSTLETEFMSFPEKALVRDIQHHIQSSSQVLFPVLDEHDNLAGVFSKSDLINPTPTKLILVDHNELSQAVTGAEEAEILEVVDHHKLGGGLTSREPIRFVNEPVGSTCTIVARSFHQAGIKPTPSIAICMAAGIISDTLHLTSPTTTRLDKEMLHWIEEVGKINAKKLSEEFFSTGSVLQTSPAQEAIRADCKEYTENGWKIAVSQVEEQGLDHFHEYKQPLKESLESLNKERGLDFSCLLVTDITTHYSLLLAAGSPKILNTIDYPRLEDDLFELEGIVSRKKQLLPSLIWSLNKISKTA